VVSHPLDLVVGLARFTKIRIVMNASTNAAIVTSISAAKTRNTGASKYPNGCFLLNRMEAIMKAGSTIDRSST
jgi:hypothetical protein